MKQYCLITIYLLYLYYMYINSLFVSTILIGSLLILIMLFSGRTNLKVNLYLILLLFQLILHRLVILYFSTNFGEVQLSEKYPAILSIIFLPCWYLYIRTLLTRQVKVYKDLPHFIIPFLITLVNFILFDTPFKFNVILSLLLGLYYVVIIFRLIKAKTNNFLTKDRFLERWVYVMYFVFIFIFLSAVILKFFSGINSDQWLIDFYVLTSTVWFNFIGLYFFKPDHSLWKNIINSKHCQGRRLTLVFGNLMRLSR